MSWHLFFGGLLLIALSATLAFALESRAGPPGEDLTATTETAGPPPPQAKVDSIEQRPMDTSQSAADDARAAEDDERTEPAVEPVDGRDNEGRLISSRPFCDELRGGEILNWFLTSCVRR